MIYDVTGETCHIAILSAWNKEAKKIDTNLYVRKKAHVVSKVSCTSLQDNKTSCCEQENLITYCDFALCLLRFCL